MFEYMNPGILLVGTLSIIGSLLVMILTSGKAYHDNKEVKPPYMMIFLLVISVGMMIEDGLSNKEKVLKNIKSFKENKTLRCHTLGSTYIVSKEEGWSRHKDGFTKNDLFFKLEFCEAEEE